MIPVVQDDREDSDNEVDSFDLSGCGSELSSRPSATPGRFSRCRPVSVQNGVIGVMVHPSTFIEESNFYISEVVLKVKMRNSEAGWVVKVTEVTGEEAQMCFFTTSDAKSTRKFVKVLNQSLECGSIMCQLQDAELDKYVMKITTDFCRRQKAIGRSKSEYVKIAAECLGRQPQSKVWILNSDMHTNEHGELIPHIQRDYIWLGSLIKNRKLSNVALATDAAVVTPGDPYFTFGATLRALKAAVGNNYVPAFMLIAAGSMGMHYESVMDIYGMCPTPIAVGPKNAGKSTAATTLLSLMGTPQFFVRNFTATAPGTLNSRKTFPTVFDDPDDLTKVKALIDDAFNRGIRSTSKESTVTRAIGIVTLNLDRVRKLCSNYKEASRVVLIPFERAGQSSSIDDTELLAVQKKAGTSVMILIKLGKVFEMDTIDRADINSQIVQLFTDEGANVESRVVRTYTILLFFAIKLAELLSEVADGLLPTREDLFGYFRTHIIPAVMKWQTVEVPPPPASDTLNGTIRELIGSLQESDLTISDVLRMVNPRVSNADRSESFIAVVIDDLLSTGLVSQSKLSIERAVKDSGLGSTVDARYFLKQGVSADSLSGLPKSQLRKRRCCTINTKLLDNKLLLDLKNVLSGVAIGGVDLTKSSTSRSVSPVRSDDGDLPGNEMEIITLQQQTSDIDEDLIVQTSTVTSDDTSIKSTSPPPQQQMSDTDDGIIMQTSISDAISITSAVSQPASSVSSDAPTSTTTGTMRKRNSEDIQLMDGLSHREQVFGKRRRK